MLTFDFGYWKTDKRSEGSFIAFVKQNLLKLHTAHFSTVPRLIQNPVEYGALTLFWLPILLYYSPKILKVASKFANQAECDNDSLKILH